MTEAAVTSAVAAAVHGRLVELYQPVAARNYRSVAKEFNEAADRFTAAARTIDPESDSDAVLRAAGGARQVWFTSGETAEQLDKLSPVIYAAAELVPGAPSGIAKLVEESDGLRLALLCDPRKTHVRRVWEAFKTSGGRCGRWSRAASLGHRDPRPR